MTRRPTPRTAPLRPGSRTHRGRVRTIARGAVAVSLLAAPLLLTACSPTISVPAAAGATEPVCASVVLDTPDPLLTEGRVATSSQATTAWGRSGRAITLRCGVARPAPSAQCVSIENPDGTTVDWIATQGSDGWTFVTYGRSPAIEVQVPDSLHVGQPTAPLVDLAPAAQDVTATAECH